MQFGDDVVMSGADATEWDDRVLAEAIAETAARPLAPARVDISGLQAISALAPDHVAPSPENHVAPAIAWHAFGHQNDEELYLARNSA